MIDNTLLHTNLSYCPSTGIFTRKGKAVGRINKDGYLEIQLQSKRHLAHRLAWQYVYGAWPTSSIDHANRNKLDNSIANLRYLTPSQQAQNTNLHPRNVSGYRGVSWDTNVQKWRARIRVDNKKYSLGYYTTPEAAYEAYLKAVPIYHTHNPLCK